MAKVRRGRASVATAWHRPHRGRGPARPLTDPHLSAARQSSAA